MNLANEYRTKKRPFFHHRGGKKLYLTSSFHFWFSNVIRVCFFVFQKLSYTKEAMAGWVSTFVLHFILFGDNSRVELWHFVTPFSLFFFLSCQLLQWLVLWVSHSPFLNSLLISPLSSSWCSWSWLTNWRWTKFISVQKGL